MKKIISTLVIACAIMGFTACGEPKPTTTDSTSTTPDSTMQNKPDTSMQSTPSQPDTLHNN